MRQVFQQGAVIYRAQFLGQILPVLWEKAVPIGDLEWQLSGLSDNYLRVRAASSTPCHNQIQSVSITAVERDGLVGEILPK